MKEVIKIILVFAVIHFSNSQEQEYEQDKKEPPSYSLLRAKENYEYLKDIENNPYEENFFDAIKYIPLNPNNDIYLSLGGQIRPRLELYSNRLWEPKEDENFYSQRVTFHSNLVLGKHFRIFGELYHGYTNHEKEFVEYDELNFHQAFVEFSTTIKDNTNLSFRFGRLELGLGATRLVGLREGPNVRRSFDMAKVTFRRNKTIIKSFYGKEVKPLFEVFDNDYTFFNGNAANPELWGVYTQFKIKGFTGLNELYYLGFQSDYAMFNDVSGEEKRHTIGLRRFGKLGKHFQYNTEIIYQFGELGNTTISAFDIETDWHYKILSTPWKPNLGIKLQYTSGDKNANDNKLNTFNPMFVNPAYYSLALTMTPINIISVHPSISVTPTEKLTLYTEWAFFWRASENDGLYKPPRFVNIPANGISDKDLGNQLGFKAAYEFNRHLSFDLDMSYFIAGDFQKASGDVKNIFHFAPTFNYKF